LKRNAGPPPPTWATGGRPDPAELFGPATAPEPVVDPFPLSSGAKELRRVPEQMLRAGAAGTLWKQTGIGGKNASALGIVLRKGRHLGKL